MGIIDDFIAGFTGNASEELKQEVAAEMEQRAASEASTASKQARGTDTPKTEVKGQGEDEDSKLSKLFEEQCFVLDALEDFALGNQGITYENFVTLNGTKEDAALLVSKINSRFGKDKNGLSQFMNITPAQYSMLVPKIRLYVQKMQDEKDSFGVIQEIKFRDFTGQNSIDDIMNSAQGRGDGAGLISFSYEFDGRDPGSVSNMIRGELRFLFTDFDTIVKPIRGFTAEEKDHMAPVTDQERDYLKPRFLDLIVRQPTRRKIQGKSLPYLIRVHAEIGWMEPEDTSGQNLFPKELKEYIRDGFLNEYLVLEILEHEMDFKEDGRVELSIEYRASIENALFNKTDILALDDQKEKQMKEELEKEKNKSKVPDKIDKARKERLGRGGQLTVVTTNKDGSVKVDTQNDKNATLLDRMARSGAAFVGSFFNDDASETIRIKKHQDQKIEFTKEKQKIARYRKLLGDLEDSNKIRFVDLDPNLLKQWTSGIQLAALYSDPKQRPKRLTASQLLRKTGIVTTTTGPPAPGQNSLGEQLNIGGTAQSTQSIKAVGKQLDKMEKAGQERVEAAKQGDTVKSRTTPKSNLEYDKEKADQAPGTGKHRVHFMYLGDVMDIACKTLYDLDPYLGMIRIVSGPIQYVSRKDLKMKNINLADVPISLEALTDWIYRNIVAKGINSMSLGSFLTSLTTDLVFNALGQEGCFSDIVEHPSMMMTPLSLNLEGPSSGQMQEPIPRSGGKYPRTPVNTFASKAKNNLASRGDLNGRKRVSTITYVFLNGVVREENNFNYGINSFNVEFHKNGVYNLGIGRDRGIVKNIKFTKSDAPYQTEMRVEQREANDGFTLGEFRQVYNATVKLVGNTLFRNGQYVRLDPTTMGLEQRTAIELGLGGMYVITKVEGELSRSGYETTLTCKYNSTGFAKAKKD
jgi:hypothetical protein